VTGRRSARAAFCVLAMIEFVSVMDASIVNIALPSIGQSLGFSPTMLAWVVDGYLIGLAGFMLVAGRATDLIGRRRLFLTGVAVFTMLSGVCSFATDPWQLIVSRVGQGVGAALAMPSAIALITDLFPEGASRNRALGMFNGMAGVASPVGLVLGGVLASVSWRWIFLINIPLGVVAFIAGIRTLPAPRRRSSTPMDLLGGLALTSGLIFLTLAVLRGGVEDGGTTTLAVLASAVILLVLFGIRQATARDPLIPRELLRSRTIVAGNLTFILVGTILLGTFFITTLFLQQVRGLAPLEAAVLYLPIPAAMFVGTQVAPRLTRFSPSNTLLGAMVIQAASLGAWALLMRSDSSLLLGFMVPAAPWAFGLGAAIVLSFMVCTSGVAPQIAGAASGLATTAYQGGGAIGLATIAFVADTCTAAVGTGPAALIPGFKAALWVSAGLALVGALEAGVATFTSRHARVRRRSRNDGLKADHLD